MSADASAPAREGVSDLDDYDEMQDRLERLIEEGTQKIETGRIRDAEKERVRQGWYRAVANLIGEWRKMKEASDLEELRADVDALKEDGDPP